jgi:hypothetical protein
MDNTRTIMACMAAIAKNRTGLPANLILYRSYMC